MSSAGWHHGKYLDTLPTCVVVNPFVLRVFVCVWLELPNADVAARCWCRERSCGLTFGFQWRGYSLGMRFEYFRSHTKAVNRIERCRKMNAPPLRLTSSFIDGCPTPPPSVQMQASLVCIYFIPSCLCHSANTPSSTIPFSDTNKKAATLS